MSADRVLPDRPTAAPLRITGGALIQPDGTNPADLTIVDGRVDRIDPIERRPGVAPIGDVEPLDRHRGRFDATGLLVAPGLIDLQINGGHGHDLWADPARLWDLATLLPRYGVTAFCPTIISGPTEVVERALAALRAGGGAAVGAEPLGLHLEGPMLAPNRRGAHDPAHLRAPGTAAVAGLTRAAGVRVVTLAPELPGALEVIAALRGAGVVVAAGHSDATAEQAAAAAEAGLSLVTHLFNAMAPLHHRQPGLVGYTLGTKDLTAGLIVDGIHLAPQVVALALQALGPERLVLVSDAVAAMGLGPGTHRLGARTVTAGPDGVRRPDGTLAGSDLTLDRAMRNLIDQTGCSLGVAVGAASSNPARVLGEDDRGRLESGAVADVVVLDPSDLRVVATFCRGHLAHCEDDAAWRHQPVSA